MITRSVLAAAAALPLAACVVVVDGGGTDLAASYADDRPLLPSETSVEPFGEIAASAGTDVTLERADGYRLVFDGDARARTTYEVDGDTLRVTCRKVRMGRCARGDRGAVTVYAPTVAALSASSGAVLAAKGDFESVPSLTVRVSSGGTVDARAVVARRVDAKATSGGDARVAASGVLTARASSGGSIRYEGEPQAEVSTSSGGSVRRD